MLREVKVFVTKYYRHPYIHKLYSAGKQTQFFKKKVTIKAIILGTILGALQDYYSGKMRKTRPVTPLFYINVTPPLTISYEYNFFSNKLFHKTAPNH